MRYFVALAVCLCAIFSAVSASAGVKTDGISYQGLLTDPSDHPIADGPHDLILSIWTDSLGGAMLHSETVVVTTSKGLFSTCIGCASSTFSELFTDQSLFLQTQLAGQAAMTPRTRLHNVPFSNSASSLHGEATAGSTRARGIIVVKPGGGTSQGSLLLDADTDGDGHADFTVTDSASTTSASRVMSRDSDDDGVSDGGISLSVTPTTSGVAIKTKGTGADPNRVVLIQQLATPLELSTVSSIDNNGDTNPETEISQSLTPTTCGVAIKTKGTGADPNRVALIRLRATPTDLSTASSIDDDGDTVPESEISQSVTPTTCGVAIKVKGTGADKDRVLLIQSGATPTTVSSVCAIDNDSDNVPESQIAQSLTPTTCGVAIQTKGTGADKNRTISSQCDDSSAVQVVEVDNDGDGHAEARAAVSSVSSLGGGGGGGASSAAYARMTCDTDDDGVPENEASMSVTPTTSSVAIKTKGTGADANRVVLIRMRASPTDLSTASSIDDDGDTVPESEISQSVTPTTCGVAIKVKGTGADKDRVLLIQSGATPTTVSSVCAIDNDSDNVPESQIAQSLTPTTCGVAIQTKGTGADKNRTISSQCDDSSAVQVVEVDDDGDGHAEARAAVSSVSSLGGGGGGGASSAAYARMTCDTDDDGIPENEAAMTVTPTTCGVAINTKGTGADKNRTISSQCDDSSAVHLVDIDDDGDGNSEARGIISVKSASGTGATGRCALDSDSDDDGIPDQEASMIVTPINSSVAIKTKGTGADANRVVGGTDDTTASVLLATDSASISLKVRKGGTVTGAINVNSGSALRASMGSDGKAFFATGVGVGITATHAVDVAGGAYCDGTNWVNASDVNAKENFEKVDGEELLDKIDRLEITKWNYKSDTKTGHIGPTAQNFEATFGVGSDGKSISTIDPSGIALAAIKALNKQNRDLKQENDALKQRLDALAQQVERLAASR